VTDPVEQRIVSALANDLEDNAGLPSHLLVKYRRPRAILPADCPMLVVWLLFDRPAPLETETFQTVATIGISWHEETVEEAAKLSNDSEVSLALISALSKIKARLRALASAGLTDPAVGEAWQVLPGETAYLSPDMAQGLVEGYALEAIVDLTE
jgi:hypothetical protein